MSECGSVFVNGVLVCIEELAESARQILDFYSEANKVLLAPRIIYGRSVERVAAVHLAEHVSLRQHAVASGAWATDQTRLQSALGEMAAADRQLTAHVRGEARAREKRALDRLVTVQNELGLAANRLPQEPATRIAAAEAAGLAGRAVTQSKRLVAVGKAVCARGVSGRLKERSIAATRAAKELTSSLLNSSRSAEDEMQTLERVAGNIAEARARVQVLCSDGWRSLLPRGSVGGLRAVERKLATAAKQVAKGDSARGISVLQGIVGSVSAPERRAIDAAHALWARNLELLITPALGEHGFASKRRRDELVAQRTIGAQQQTLTIRFAADGGVHYEPIGFHEHACQPVIEAMREALQESSEQFSEEPPAHGESPSGEDVSAGWSWDWGQAPVTRRKA